MSRNYPNFLDAYVQSVKDKFVPEKFHFWTGVSAVAGALERKVWLPWTEHFSYYPNLYVLLVSHPGIGKSSAITPGIGMLRKIPENQIKFIPSQVTEARLIEIMRHPITTHIAPGKFLNHCSGYYYASEASACLKDIYGGFINTVTAFYDCDAVWEKATVGMGNETYKIENVCFNLLAGCTFDYLGKLITDDNIMGGFASRITYVIQKDVVERDSPWQNRTLKQADEVEQKKLLQDLGQIHRICGPMSADEGFKSRWEDWFPKFDKTRQALESEKLQSLMVRKSTTLLKLCMILSAAESDDRTLKEAHWDRAMELTDEVEKDLPDMLREGRSRRTDTQDGLNNAIFKILLGQQARKMGHKELLQKLVFMGFPPMNVETTLKQFTLDSSMIKRSPMNGVEWLELVGNPDHQL